MCVNSADAIFSLCFSLVIIFVSNFNIFASAVLNIYPYAVN